jgi:DNA-directed RNA polymerase subunit RPC12/RpoP
MKIIVNNEDEAKLIRDFLVFAHDMTATEAIEKLEDPTDRALTSDQYFLIQTGLFDADLVIEVNKNEKHMTHEDTERITGVCIHCKAETTGLINDSDVTFSEYIRLKSDKAKETWHCEDCQYKTEEPV